MFLNKSCSNKSGISWYTFVSMFSFLNEQLKWKKNNENMIDKWGSVKQYNFILLDKTYR